MRGILLVAVVLFLEGALVVHLAAPEVAGGRQGASVLASSRRASAQHAATACPGAPDGKC